MKIKSFYGIDACHSGWIMIVFDKSDHRFSYSFSATFSALFANHKTGKAYSRFLVDMPVGLPPAKNAGDARMGQRSCDMQARKILGKKHASIFNPPCRQALAEKNYDSASATNYRMTGKKISRQSWNIVPRIKEVDEYLQKHRQADSFILESHPEIAFQKLNLHIPLQYSKKSTEGIQERLAILSKYMPEAKTVFMQVVSDKTLRGKVRKDDIVDALVLCVLNYQQGSNLYNITDEDQEDEMGLRMGIWW